MYFKNGRDYILAGTQGDLSFLRLPTIEDYTVNELLEKQKSLVKGIGLLINRHTLSCCIFEMLNAFSFNCSEGSVIELASIADVPDDLHGKITQVQDDRGRLHEQCLKLMDVVFAGHIVLLNS